MILATVLCRIVSVVNDFKATKECKNNYYQVREITISECQKTMEQL